MNNKRGFTLIETILSMLLGATLVLTAIVTPVMLLRQMKSYNETVERQHTMQIMVLALENDIKESSGRIRYDGEYLIIKDAAYSFEDDGVYREVMGNSKKISSMKLELTFLNDAFIISSIEDTKSDSIKLHFNKGYSSFDKGDV